MEDVIICSQFKILLIVILAVLFNEISSDCDTGWFGRKCQYKCWCENSNCLDSGECASGVTCVVGWFGPSCQYEDKVFTSITSAPEWMIDQNDTTCNGNASGMPITVTFYDYFYFTWLRIVVSNTSFVPDFILKFNDNAYRCINQRLFHFRTTVFDITCNMPKPINNIEISGHTAGGICNLFVSGGRNVALKQTAVQTSTSDVDGILRVAMLAVDGNTSYKNNEESCTHTLGNDSTPSWTVFYNPQVNLYRTDIYNAASTGLRSFLLRTFNIFGAEIETYNEPGLKKRKYQVPFTKALDETYRLSISHTKVLRMCEVETFGDVPCSEEYWGLDCSKKCKCDDREKCFHVTGNCTFGCSIGFYGPNCDKSCPSQCEDKSCNYVTGDCFSCKGGYHGITCNIGDNESSAFYKIMSFFIVMTVCCALLGYLLRNSSIETENEDSI